MCIYQWKTGHMSETVLIDMAKVTINH